jgi:hypothetical protein
MAPVNVSGGPALLVLLAARACLAPAPLALFAAARARVSPVRAFESSLARWLLPLSAARAYASNALPRPGACAAGAHAASTSLPCTCRASPGCSCSSPPPVPASHRPGAVRWLRALGGFESAAPSSPRSVLRRRAVGHGDALRRRHRGALRAVRAAARGRAVVGIDFAGDQT